MELSPERIKFEVRRTASGDNHQISRRPLELRPNHPETFPQSAAQLVAAHGTLVHFGSYRNPKTHLPAGLLKQRRNHQQQMPRTEFST